MSPDVPVGYSIRLLSSFEDGHIPDVAVLDVPDREDVENSCYSILVDLLTGYWRYVLRRETTYWGLSIRDVRKRSRRRKHPRYEFTANLSSALGNGLPMVYGRGKENRRFRIALQRFGVAYKRKDPLDSVLDCSAALESLFTLPNELRLRLSLSIFYLLSRDKKYWARVAYEMYGIRSKFIHGASIPTVGSDGQGRYISLVARALEAAAKTRTIPGADYVTEHIFGE